jgi:hypothetical protein
MPSKYRSVWIGVLFFALIVVSAIIAAVPSALLEIFLGWNFGWTQIVLFSITFAIALRLARPWLAPPG